ncbi:MAG: hypothetical protein HYR56_11935 [Acidobacteria bacterium]|nr:hypothetical protein [Acidobacteriota bacterium]MBI3428092.1 hypothetical protein [Acidobacteriota bacterium]
MTISTVRRLPGFRFEPRAPQLTEALPRMDVAILVGFAAAGPLDVPVAVEDFAQFTAVFGGRLPLAWDAAHGTQVHAYLAPTVKAFFDNGGRRCWVIRVAGEDARRNFFPLPGLAAATFDAHGNLQSVQPAYARARAVGSWSDGLRVSATLLSTRFNAASLVWPALQLELEADAASVQAGDLLRLTFADADLVAFLEVQTVEVLPRSTAAERAKVRITGGQVLWGRTSLADSPPLATHAGQAVLYDPASNDAELPQRQTTGRREYTPVLSNAPVAAELLEDATDTGRFTVALQLPLAALPAPGSLLRLEFGGEQLLLVVADTRVIDTKDSPPQTATCVSGPGLWLLSAAPATAPGPLTAVESLTLELWAQTEAADAQRLGDLGLTAGSARAWGALPTDEQLYQNPLSPFERQRVETAFDNERLAAWRTQDQRRFPLAGHSTAASFTFPLAALVTPQWYLPALKRHDLALERDGLAHFDATLFLDRDITETGVHNLLNQADQLRYLNPVPRALRGLHAALGFGDSTLVEEATLIAVPDAVHRAWDKRVEPALPQPLPPVPEPAPAAQPLFQQCDQQTLPAPTALTVTHALAQNVFTLTWQAAAAARSFSVQEATRPDYSDAVTLWQGAETQLTITDRTPGDYFYRVRASDDCRESGWSIGVAVRVPVANEFELVPASAFKPDTLLAVQRALLRMCAARGDLLAVLALPEQFDTPAALSYQALLNPAGAAPAFTLDFGGVHKLSLPLDAGEMRALSYAALYHPWPFVQTTTQPVAIPPDGLACGVLAARALNRGAWIAPANELLRGVVALTPPIARAQWLDWQSAQLNLLRQEARGFVVLSADTLSRDEDLRPIGVRRLLMLLRRLAQRLGARYVFEPNDESFRRAVQRGFTVLLDDLFARGAFAGDTPATAYQVVADSALNALQQEQGRFTVELKVAPSLPLTFLTLRVIQTGDRTRVIETGAAIR